MRFFKLYQVRFTCKKLGTFDNIYLSWNSSKMWVFKHITAGFSVKVNVSFKKIMMPC